MGWDIVVPPYVLLVALPGCWVRVEGGGGLGVGVGVLSGVVGVIFLCSFTWGWVFSVGVDWGVGGGFGWVVVGLGGGGVCVSFFGGGVGVVVGLFVGGVWGWGWVWVWVFLVLVVWGGVVCGWGLGGWLVWLVVCGGGCWGWVFFVLFCLLFFGVFLLWFVCFGVGWWVGGGVVCCVGLSVGACCCLVGGWCVVGLLCGGLGWLGVGWGCGLGFAVWGSAGCVLVVLGEWHGVWCLLPGCLYVVCAVVGAVSASCAVGVWVWVWLVLVGVGVGAGWWVEGECVGVCVFFVEFGGGLGGGLGFADLLPFEVVEAAGGVECAVDCCCGADCWGLVLVGCVCGGGVYEGVCLLVGGLFCWGCGVVPVFEWALEEDEWGCEGCGEPGFGGLCFWWCVFGPVGEVADGVCWCGEGGCECPGCGCGEEGVELCWCGERVVAVDDGGCSCVVLCVCLCLLAVCVGDGCGGGCVWCVVVLFPILCGGGVCE